MMRSSQPGPSGLYDPRFEHDACGVSFVVDIKGRATRRIVELAMGALCNLEHRGATGAESDTGDGAGILLQVPDRFLREAEAGHLPPVGQYAVGTCFLPEGEVEREKTAAASRRNRSGTWSRMPAPSPVSDSAPVAPRCSRLHSAPMASSTIRLVARPLMSTTNDTPQASCSNRGS